MMTPWNAQWETETPSNLFGGRFHFVNPALPSVKKNSQQRLLRVPTMAFSPGGWCGCKMKTLNVVGLPLEYIQGCVTLERQQIETLTLCSPMKQCMWERERDTHTHELWDHKLCERRMVIEISCEFLWFASNWSEEKFQGVGIWETLLQFFI